MFVVVRHDIVVIRRWGVVWASPGGNFSIGGGRQGPAPAPSVVVHSSHPRQKPASALNPWTINTGGKDGEDEEGEGAPLVQGGEGQGAKEVLRPNRWKLTLEYLCLYVFVSREAARASKEASRRSEAKVCPNWSPAGKEAWSEEQQMIRSQFHQC